MCDVSAIYRDRGIKMRRVSKYENDKLCRGSRARAERVDALFHALRMERDTSESCDSD